MSVELSDPASADLDRHWNFLIEAYDEDHAQRTPDLIDAGITFLSEHPGAGQYGTELDHLGRGHRRWVVGYYKLVYLNFEDRLVITEIFDTRQDPATMKG